MNILFLTKESPYPPNNGHKRRTFNLVKGLSKKHRVNLVCSGDGKGHKGGGPLINLFSPVPFMIKKRYSPLMRDKIRESLDKNNIDLIFCDSLYQAPYVPQNRCKKILCEHNIESMIIYRYYKLEKNLLKKLYAFIEFLKMRRFENKNWRRFDSCFVVSDKDRELMKARIKKENIQIIPNGVDINHFSPRNIEVEPFSLIYTGQMNWQPNNDAVIYFLTNIYPLIKKQIPEVSFLIVGNNPSEKIRKIAGEDKSIIITGFVEDIRPYVAKANVFVVPLRIASGTRLKILEALAMGKAVVSTSVGCEGLDVTQNENILIADEPEDFAQKVVELFRNASLVKILGATGRTLVEEKYSWDKIRERLDRVAKKVISDV